MSDDFLRQQIIGQARRLAEDPDLIVVIDTDADYPGTPPRERFDFGDVLAVVARQEAPDREFVIKRPDHGEPYLKFIDRG